MRHILTGRGRVLTILGTLAVGALAVLHDGSGAPAPPVRVAATPRAVAVTFDDLPVISVTPLDATARRALTERLLAAVTRESVPATGFVNEYGLYGFARAPLGPPDAGGVALLDLWIDAGCDLGNHGFAHADLHAGTVDDFLLDIARGEAVTRPLLRARGRELRYFRHPYLHTGLDLGTRTTIERWLAAHGYRVAPVTIDNEDWLFAAAYSRATALDDADLARRVAAAYIAYTAQAFDESERLATRLFGRDIRQVLLVHANALNADHFDALARMIRDRGYAFVTLEDALSDPAYGSADRYVGPESITWLARWAVTRGLLTDEDVLDEVPEVPGFVSAAAEEPQKR